jgi:hypothetical protein
MDKAKGQVELLPLSVFSILPNWKQAGRMSSSDNHLDHLFLTIASHSGPSRLGGMSINT